MKHWKRIFAGFLAAAVAAAGNPCGLLAQENMQQKAERIISGVIEDEEDAIYQNLWERRGDVSRLLREELADEESGNEKTPKEILGFAEIEESEQRILIRKKRPLKSLTEQMPDSVLAYAAGQDDPVEVPVEWDCVGEYEESNFYYYQFIPVWDQDLYRVSKKIELPYISVFIGTDANMKFATAQENRETIYDFMKKQMGFNTAAACGVLANIQAESSFNPTASMIDTNGLLSYGLCQWNGPRFTALQQYCDRNNLDYETVEGQLSYLKYELEHSEASACAKVRNVPNTAEGAYTAGYNWARYFERCASVYFETRAKLARDTYWPTYSNGSERTKYKITYELDGGTNHDGNPGSYYDTTGDIVFKDPVREGYIFKGWFSDSKKKTQIKAISGKTMQNITIYAKWEPIHFTIRFQGNGAESGAMPEMPKLEYDCLYTLKANKYKKTGYQFDGWNTKKNGKGDSYDNKEDVQNLTAKDGGIITLYAQWKRQGYKLTYVLGGGENHDDNPASYTFGSKTIKLKKPKRTGYTFSGWYRDRKYTQPVNSIAQGSTGKVTFYAKWTVHNYRIVFNGNGATSGKMTEKIACRYGKSYKLKSNKFKKSGYIFAGWNTQKDGSGRKLKNKASVKNLTAKDDKTVTLYAQWEKISYSIQYVLNGGQQNADNPTSYFQDSDTLTLRDPVRTGYTFAGWYTDSAFQNPITSIKKGSKTNYTLYARWTVNHYTIRFDGNGADSGQMASMTGLEYNTQYTLTPSAFQKTGQMFLGWNTKQDGSGTFYKDQATVYNLLSQEGAELVLYAQWG